MPTLSGCAKKAELQRNLQNTEQSICKDVGMLWKTRKGYVLKRDQSIVTKKFNHMRIKGPPAGNYVTGDPRESSVIRDVIPSAGMSETQGSRQKIL